MNPASQSQSPYSLLHMLQQQLAAARARNADILARSSQAPTIRIPGIGHAISGAYEQLRNAAEYAEEHLLLQRAIRRFYNRSLSLSAHSSDSNIGDELVVELTQAGYLTNNTISAGTAAQITALSQKYAHAYRSLKDARIPSPTRLSWVLDVLSVETEAMLNPQEQNLALARVAYQHYLQVFPRKKLVTAEEDGQYELCLYIAVHRSLLKSDIATVRHDLLNLYGQTPNDAQKFAAFNKVVDERYNTQLTHKLRRVVNRYGAPMRVLKNLADDRTDLPELLNNRQFFLEAYTHQTRKDYKNLARRLNKGIVKSILFVFITKIVVGIGIEIPYDLLVAGSVSAVPLAINLLFPPLYMASFKLGLRAPSLGNAEALRSYTDQILYDGTPPPEYAIKLRNKPVSGPVQFVYTLLFFIPLATLVYLLALLNFNVVQGVIFFVFLSTVSLLGFRLSRMVREMELVNKETGFLSAVFDFLRLPFIVAGQWISGRYSQLNIVAYVLDIAIELPLKMMLRLVRQWTRFLTEKHEEIY